MDNSYIPLFGIMFAIFHELGHLIPIYLKSGKCLENKKISFGIVNIGIENDLFYDKNFDSNLVLISGPLINFVLGIIFCSIYFFNKAEIIKIFSIQNFILCFINLLPITSFDGGKILYNILSEKINPIFAYKCINFISIIFLVPLFTLGLFILIKSKYNFSILILGCYIISYIFFKA